MPKIKLPTKSPHIDMTPMVDLFSLLLTFFMLTTSFRPQEAAQIDSPASISETTAPETNVMTVMIGKDDKVFFNIDNGADSSNKFRGKIFEEVGKRFSITFSKDEIEKFAKLSSFGMPIANMKNWLHSESSKEKEQMQTGIPIDSTDNQLEMWILYTRQINPQVQAAIKGDGASNYKVVKRILDILQDKNVNKFNLTTNLEKVEVKLSDIK